MAAHAFVIGLGRVGLATAVCLAELGCRVSAHDRDFDRLDALTAAELDHDEDPDLISAFSQALREGHISLIRNGHIDVPIDFAFICIGTPLRPDGHPAINGLRDTLLTLATHTPGNFILVLKSVPPPGQALSHLQAVLSKLRSQTRSLPIIINPDFSSNRYALHDFRTPSHIVIGADDDKAAHALAELYAPFRSPTLLVSPISAQLIQYASSALHATKFAFLHEMLNLAQLSGADVRSLAEGLALDPCLGVANLETIPGDGMASLAREVRALGQLVPSAIPGILDATLRFNERLKETTICNLLNALGTLQGKTICLVGLSQKEGTHGVLETSKLELIDTLRLHGASIHAFDPQAGWTARIARPADDQLQYFDDAYTACGGANALVINSDLPESLTFDWPQIAGQLQGERIVIGGSQWIDAGDLYELGLCFIPFAG